MNGLSFKEFSIHLDGVCLVNQLNTEFAENTFVAILGNNGVGKTSLLKSLYGSLPFKGQALFCGRKISKDDLTYLPQNNFLGFDILVSDFLVMSRYKYSKTSSYTTSDYESGYHFLKKLACEHLYTKMFFSLSGGEQQLIWLAQTLNCSSNIILLDEPCQGLDAKNRIMVYNILSELAKTEKKLIVCVSHDLYDLQSTQGYFLNLSEANPSVEPISAEALTRTYKKLLK